jgi:hypothetical protein
LPPFASSIAQNPKKIYLPPDRPNRLPDPAEGVPDSVTAIPEPATALPDPQIALPDLRIGLPDFQTRHPKPVNPVLRHEIRGSRR